MLKERRLKRLNAMSNPMSKKPKTRPMIIPSRALTCEEPVGLDSIYVVIKKILNTTKSERIKAIEIFIISPNLFLGLSMFQFKASDGL